VLYFNQAIRAQALVKLFDAQGLVHQESPFIRQSPILPERA